jgi:gluconokinase
MSPADTAGPSPRALIVIMGISGCGKSTIGSALARQNNWPFLEGDDFHPPENIEKMASGTALTDDDRRAWVTAIMQAVDAHPEATLVLACSALTPFVRSRLAQTDRALIYIHLSTQSVDMVERLTRRDHFMPADLLPSQRASLSVPLGAYEFDASQAADEIVKGVMGQLEHLRLA